MLSPRWRKVFRDLWDNKSRTMLVVLSIAIGVFAFGSLFIARYVSNNDLDDTLAYTNVNDITFTIPGFDDDLVRWAARQPGVTGSEAVTISNTTLIGKDGKSFGMSLTAYADYENIVINRISPEEGAWPLKTGELYVERTFADNLGFSIGDEVTLDMPDGRRETLIYGGTVYDFSIRPGGIQTTVSAYVTPETLHRIGLPTYYNQLMVTVDDSTMTLSERANLLRDDLLHMGVNVSGITINEDGHWASGIFNGLATVLVFVGLVSLLLSTFLVVNTISGFMAQQKRPIGIMKIIGASRGQIISIYMVMVACFGVMALILAMPTSLLFAGQLLGIVNVYLNLDIVNFYMPPYIFVMEIAVAIGTPMIAALFPVLSGTSIPPAQAISDYAVQNSHNPLDLLLARIKGLSRPVLLSIRNTFRRKTRLLVTLITLTLAGAFFISIMNVRNGLNVDLNVLARMSEYDILYSFSGYFNQEAVERRVMSLSGVTDAESWIGASVAQSLPGDTQGSNFSLTGIPYDSTFVDPPLLAGRWLEAPTYNNRNDIIVSDDLLSDAGIEVGDILILKYGDVEDDWHVIGVIDSFGASAYTYYDSVARLVGRPNLADRVAVKVINADSTVANQLEASLEQQGLEVARTTLRTDVLAGLTGGFNVLVLVLLAMGVLIAFVAGLGLTGTMSLNVLERTREIGVMRAVGAGTNTLRFMFVGEGVMIGLLSFLVALPLSIPATYFFGGLLGNIIFEQPLSYAPTIDGPLIWLVMVLLVSIFASIVPAQRASEISIREALAYE
ncbi:FtsX-like permease family protein [Phototrophicus methaneseepsis]|uniref:FtsX-like permease family protein n=1 Tax=Phototrophicus methaneseepsis TaxID=2710758 RepID=A0A7S8E6L0_9CHLR|nr:FtsX-like permease family protein [Phototrophicus methaneseepsis]QPC81302.1 FtsX-like permease family protein [Phototrophicus methaneseepsis]